MVQRNKTFTGCFTCRTRKIRCDLRRPLCRRCLRMGIECEGYGIKLRWLAPLEFRHHGASVSQKLVAFEDKDRDHQRRKVDSVEWSDPYATYEDMDKDLAILHHSGLDPVLKSGVTKCLGPFGVFLGQLTNSNTSSEAINSKHEIDSPQKLATPTDNLQHSGHDIWIAQELLQGAYITAAAMGNDQYLDNLLNDEFRFDDGDFDFYSLVFRNQPVPVEDTTPSHSQPQLAVDTSLPLLDIQLYPQDDQGVSSILQIVDTPGLSVPALQNTVPTTALKVQPLTRYLLNYYITEVADLMTVIPLTENPWKTIYFPRALAALGELSGLGHTLTAKNALLYALLAVLAFNLQLKFPSKLDLKTFYLKLGGRLRSQALYFINQLSISHCVSKEKYKDVLCAIMLMILVDLVWGTMQGTHYYIEFCGEVIRAKMKHKRKLLSKARVLHRIFSSLKLIQDLTCLDPKQIHANWGMGFRENAEHTSTTLTPEFVDQKLNNTKKKDENFATDALYGLPNSLIRLFAATVDMVRTRIYEGTVPVSEANSLRLQLDEWSLEWQLNTEDGGMQEATYHHIVLFHYALTIYFDRFILDTPIERVQPAVRHTLNHLNAIIRLIQKGTARIIPLFWQGFIAGCEATLSELQQGFKQWGADIAQYLGSYWGARQIMLEVWRRRSHHEAHDDWVHVIKDWRTNLMLN